MTPRTPRTRAKKRRGGLLEKEKDPGSTPECALEARAARLVWERTSETGDGPAETRSEERVDARGLVLTYVDAGWTRPRPRATVSRMWKRRGTGRVPARVRARTKGRKKKKKKTSVKTSSRWLVRSAASRVVSGSRFSGNAAAAAASVAPARTVTCDGARCLWDPDAHFALLRVRAAWAQLAEQRWRSVSETFRNRTDVNAEALSPDRDFQNARDAEDGRRIGSNRDWRRLGRRRGRARGRRRVERGRRVVRSGRAERVWRFRNISGKFDRKRGFFTTRSGDRRIRTFAFRRRGRRRGRRERRKVR